VLLLPYTFPITQKTTLRVTERGVCEVAKRFADRVSDLANPALRWDGNRASEASAEGGANFRPIVLRVAEVAVHRKGISGFAISERRSHGHLNGGWSGWVARQPGVIGSASLGWWGAALPRTSRPLHLKLLPDTSSNPT